MDLRGLLKFADYEAQKSGAYSGRINFHSRSTLQRILLVISFSNLQHEVVPSKMLSKGIVAFDICHYDIVCCIQHHEPPFLHVSFQSDCLPKMR